MSSEFLMDLKKAIEKLREVCTKRSRKTPKFYHVLNTTLNTWELLIMAQNVQLQTTSSFSSPIVKGHLKDLKPIQTDLPRLIRELYEKTAGKTCFTIVGLLLGEIDNMMIQYSSQLEVLYKTIQNLDIQLKSVLSDIDEINEEKEEEGKLEK